MENKKSAIGIFDSGYGGLTVLKEICTYMPNYDYIYLGDNLRAPYGALSFEDVYTNTLECVKWLFSQGCHLVILACNTASAKALRTIQQNDLPNIGKTKRVLGVIRPTAEVIKSYTKTNHIGIMATEGTVKSESYLIEINKFHPQIKVIQQACPAWVNIIESGEYLNKSADELIKKPLVDLLKKDSQIDCILLGCTHYPLLINKIKQFVQPGVTILPQGEIVAKSLIQYLQNHTEIEQNCSKNGKRFFYTTGNLQDFNTHATSFFGASIIAKQIKL